MRRKRVIATSDSDEAIQFSLRNFLGCFAELVIGPATSDRTRWLAMTRIASKSTLAQPVTRQHFAHGIDQLCFRYRALCLRLLLQMLFAAFFRFGKFGADDQILDRDFAARFFVGTLDDDARGVAPVGIFHLRCEFSEAEIKLGANAGVAQLRDHVLIIADAILVEHRDPDQEEGGLDGVEAVSDARALFPPQPG